MEKNENESRFDAKKLLKSEEKDRLSKKLRTTDILKVKKVIKIPPDGGWGWVVVLSGFLALALGALPLVCYGILFHDLFDRQNVSSTNIAWIFNVHGFMWNLTALFMGPLCEEFSERKVAFIGGIFSFLSLATSAFATSSEYLYLSYAVLGGTGGSIGNNMSLLIVAKYFDKHRGLAMGMMSLGMCMGSFASPLLVNFFLDQYGYKSATLICGALVLNQCVCALLYQPVKWHSKNVTVNSDNKETNLLSLSESDEYNKLETKADQITKLRKQSRTISELSACTHETFGQSFIDISCALKTSCNSVNKTEILPDVNRTKQFFGLRIMKSTVTNLKSLRYLQVCIISISSAYLILGYVNFQMWIPFSVIDAGHSMQMAAWSLSSASVGNAIGRLCMSILADRPWFNIRCGYISGLSLIAVSIIGFSFAKDIKLIIAMTTLWGLGLGSTMSLHYTAMICTMGTEMFPAVLGVSSLSIGFQCLVFGPIVGVIRDATSSYRYALSLIGGLNVLSVCLWMLMPLAKKYDQKRKIENKDMNLEG